MGSPGANPVGEILNIPGNAFAYERLKKTLDTLGELGYVQTLSGWPGEAMASFEEANEIEKRIDPDGDELYSKRGIL